MPKFKVDDICREKSEKNIIKLQRDLYKPPVTHQRISTYNDMNLLKQRHTMTYVQEKLTNKSHEILIPQIQSRVPSREKERSICDFTPQPEELMGVEGTSFISQPSILSKLSGVQNSKYIEDESVFLLL